MKTIIKLTLVLSLFGSIAFADGDMGTGGYQPCTINCPPPPPCTENCGSGLVQATDEDSTPLSETIFEGSDMAIDIAARTLDLLF